MKPRLAALAALLAAAWGVAQPPPAVAGDAPKGGTVGKGPPQQNSQADFQVNCPEASPDGVALYRIRCPYQRGETQLRVLAPKAIEPPEERRILFILPVEAGAGTHWGDPIRAAKAAGVADKLGFIALFPTFSGLPHALMAELGIPHEFADGPQRKHHWESGWLEGAAKTLRAMLP